MAAGSKQQYKQFTIDNIEDACLALGTLITNVIINLRRYKKYSAEVVELLKNADSEYIPSDAYEAVNDKLLYRQHEILKFTADHQSSSFSYIDLRKILEKRGFLKNQLSEDITRLLNELLDVRNWTFHNPQSLMVAAKEAMEKNIPEALKDIAKVTPQLNPIPIPVVDKYELLMLASLVIHTENRIEQFGSVLQAMKTDYQEMYDSIENKPFLLSQGGFSSAVQYIDRHSVSRLTDMSSDISQISMAIQKSKYDGTDEKFKEWIIRFNGESPEEGATD
ncbi:MAG: hypothetical protein RR313_11810 [Anaerovoracaceae bacterium]